MEKTIELEIPLVLPGVENEKDVCLVEAVWVSMLGQLFNLKQFLIGESDSNFKAQQ